MKKRKRSFTAQLILTCDQREKGFDNNDSPVEEKELDGGMKSGEKNCFPKRASKWGLGKRRDVALLEHLTKSVPFSKGGIAQPFRREDRIEKETSCIEKEREKIRCPTPRMVGYKARGYTTVPREGEGNKQPLRLAKGRGNKKAFRGERKRAGQRRVAVWKGGKRSLPHFKTS